MKLEFSGAARNVTGSKHLLHVNGKKILLDCGLFQGHRREAIEANLNFPFDAREIDALVLSHAHIDHSGAIPILVKKGFRGPIYCTHATRDLCSIMLRDSAYIQEKDADWVRKKLKDPEAEPLYTMEDAEKSLSLFRSVRYHQIFSPAPGVKVRFLDAGHILGSAMEEWEIEDKDIGKTIRLGFTGDLGRKSLPILRDPEQLENLDLLITESTYGNRLHDEIADVEEKFSKEVGEALARQGKIIIPAFAVGRTQEILYLVRELQKEKKLPSFPVFIDSPLATSATEIFALHPECYDKELQKLIHAKQDPFCPDCNGVRFTQDVEESKALNNFPGPAMIISASGMCEAGRIRHHLKNNIEDQKNLILIVGFMAENTLGRKIVEGENPVNIFGDPYQLNAEVKIYNAFSAHADLNGLLRFARSCGKPKSVFLVHGEDQSMKDFRQSLSKEKNLSQSDIEIPTPGDIFELQIDKTWKKLNYTNDISRNLLGGDWPELK
ncbi:MBL fold metallo-hydrolase [Candidatus Gracilibacteria bacterium]|nr:MBL fold metallo-hydrolase [Candidatus Gracilibacteria bacterium]MCF7819064.1 MBL fold metallo-hydrolase [Candidatus Gracilibacteria bacterium]